MRCQRWATASLVAFLVPRSLAISVEPLMMAARTQTHPYLQESSSENTLLTCTSGVNRNKTGWRRTTQTESGDLNLCKHGKLVPELYVLGAPKCATTSFAYEMVGAGSMCAGNTKEYHFFGRDSSTQKWKMDHNQVTLDWLEGMPPCLRTERQLVADFTPEYLSNVKRPWKTKAGSDGSEDSLPNVFRHIYGAKAYERPQFVVMVREPLARVHSWFHYVKGKDSADSFQRVTQWELAEYKGNVWHSMYGWQLQEWLTVFHAKQFYVIPMRQFVKGDSTQICKDMSERLRFAIDCEPMAANELDASHSEKTRSLAEETTDEFRDMFYKAMQDDKDLLVQVLSMGHQHSMGLANYKGRMGDVREIQAWLEEWW